MGTKEPRHPRAALAWSLALCVAGAGCAPHEPPTRERASPERRGDLPSEVSPEDPPEDSPEGPPKPEPALTLCLRDGPVTRLQHKPYVGAAGDVTGDGQADVVALSFLGTGELAMVVLEGRNDGTFLERAPLASGGTGIELADLDGDDDLDALILDGSSAPRIRIARNEGAGRFRLGPPQRVPGRFGGELRHASFVDLDGDDDLDVVVPLWDSLRALENHGRGSLRPGQRLTVGRDPFSTAIGDLDGDGLPELVAVSGAGLEPGRDAYHSARASLWRFPGRAGGWRATPTRLELPGARRVALADLDADGALEVVASGAEGVTIVRGADEPARVDVAVDGPLLVTEAAIEPGLEIITSSYMLGALSITSVARAPRTASRAGGSFVVEMFAIDVARDGTAADVVLLNAGPPGEPYGQPDPGISTLFVDCPAPAAGRREAHSRHDAARSPVRSE